MDGFTARACALVGLLVTAVAALPSDALLDSLQLAALEHERAGRLDERDKTESLMEMLARQRLVADSSPEIPRRRLSELDRSRSDRSRREREEDNHRAPPAEVARMLADSGSSVATAPQAPAAATSSAAAAGRNACKDGPVRFRWIEPVETAALRKGESALEVRMRMEAPCGLVRVELFVDDLPPRPFPPPGNRAGAFEFNDRVPAADGIHKLEFLACDSLGTCSRSPSRETRISGQIPVPSWIPRAVGGLVLACGILGIALFLRRRPRPRRAFPASAPRPTAVPVPESTGLSGTLRKRLQLVAQEFGSGFPSVSLRLPEHPPALAADPEALGDAFSTFLRLHATRAGGGEAQILLAMGVGPVSVEVVFEDTGPTPEEEVLPTLLDPARAKVRERMGLDRELESAVGAFRQVGGSVSAEARIDGGLRIRMKIPLGSKAA